MMHRDRHPAYRVRRSGAPCIVLLAALLFGGCAPGLVVLQESPPDAPAGGNLVTTFSAPKDQVRAFPSDDPMEHLLAAPPQSPAVHAPAPPLDVELLERAIHERVNLVRTARGLTPLAWADALAPVARAHSADMADQGYFDHLSPCGDDATARARRAGLDDTAALDAYVAEGLGENLFLTHRFWEYRIYDTGDGKQTFVFDWKTADELARQTVDAWLESRTHRANLLSPVYRSQAVGVTIGKNQTLFVTQNLSCVPRR